MAESARLAALKWFCDYLEAEVNGTGDYEHDLADSVFRGRLTFGEDEPLPRVSLLEGLNADREPVVAGTGSTNQTDRWIILLQGQVKDDLLNPTDPAHALLADVKAAIGRLRREMTQDYDAYRATPWSMIADLAVEPGTVRPPDELSEKAFFWMRIVLKTVEEVDDPYWRP